MLETVAHTLELLRRASTRFDDIRIDAPDCESRARPERSAERQKMFAPAPGAFGCARACEEWRKPQFAGAWLPQRRHRRPASAASGAQNNAQHEAQKRGQTRTAARPLDQTLRTERRHRQRIATKLRRVPLDVGMEKLAVTLTDFSTLATAPAHYTLNTNLKRSGGSLGRLQAH